MIRRLIILDLALVSLLVLGGLKFRRDWVAFGPAHEASAIQPQPEALPALPAARATAGAEMADWTEIPTHNPFSFDRNDVAILAPPEPPKPVGPRPILYGTMTLGKTWIAMLASGQPNSRASRPIRVGESIDGWMVVEIVDKSVVIEANSNRETLSMDPTQLVPRDYTRTAVSAAPPVVQTVGQSTGAPASPTPSASSSSPAVSSNSSSTPSGTPCVREIKTPFGIVRQPCEDPVR